ncbi:MAG TPA: hypothetical protein VM261_11800 [Kofleriaceae bacterium]|nr:hypothetical protein [Kofleriaceae bacterium]
MLLRRALGIALLAFCACGGEGPTFTDAGNVDATFADAAADVDASQTDGSQIDATEIDAAMLDASTPDAFTPNPDGSLCGNNIVDPGETCDGNCPTSCADALTCTQDILVGTPAACDVACQHPGTGCAAGDGCCSPGCDNTTDSDCAFGIDPFYDPSYDVRDLGTAAGVPTNYGGLTVSPSDPHTLLIGGAANSAGGAIYALGLQRDPQGHIVGIVGPGVVARQGQYNDGGVVFDANGVLVLARYIVNELGFQRAGSTTTDKVVPLAPLGVATSVGGLAQVPPGHPGAGAWKLVSWSGGQWYELTLAADGTGTYDVTAAALRLTIGGGPEGIVYVPLGSPLFANASVLVSEYSAGIVATYEVDTAGDPVASTRRNLITGLTGAEGAAIDPISGDFLFSTFGGGNRIIVVRGFAN